MAMQYVSSYRIEFTCRYAGTYGVHHCLAGFCDNSTNGKQLHPVPLGCQWSSQESTEGSVGVT